MLFHTRSARRPLWRWGAGFGTIRFVVGRPDIGGTSRMRRFAMIGLFAVALTPWFATPGVAQERGAGYSP